MTLKVLVVEDEALLALELEDVIAEAGHVVVGPAMSKRDALEVAARERPDLALVDVHLLDGPTGVDIARALAADGVEVVFLTANVKRIPEDFAGAAGVIEKPYTMVGIENALGHLERALLDATSDTPPPSLRLVRPLRPVARDDAAGRAEAGSRLRVGTA